MLQPGEECDDGEGSDECSPLCRFATCGDGFIQGSEACDDGQDNADDSLCTSTCAAASCGDGFVLASNESCDDGNDVDADECSNDCIRPRLVFITKPNPDYLGGVLGADSLQHACKSGPRPRHLQGLADRRRPLHRPRPCASDAPTLPIATIGPASRVRSTAPGAKRPSHIEMDRRQRSQLQHQLPALLLPGRALIMPSRVRSRIRSVVIPDIRPARMRKWIRQTASG